MFNREKKETLQIENLSSTLTSIWVDIMTIFQKHHVYMIFHMIDKTNKNWIYICISERDIRLKSRIQINNTAEFETIKNTFTTFQDIGFNMLSGPIAEYPKILTYLYNNGYSFAHEKPHAGIFQSRARKILNYKSNQDAKNKISLLLHQVDNVDNKNRGIGKYKNATRNKSSRREINHTIQN
jgi:hypothetical protein